MNIELEIKKNEEMIEEFERIISEPLSKEEKIVASRLLEKYKEANHLLKRLNIIQVREMNK